ncbi:MAG: glycosyltransferase family 4 protein [Anaerolineae bacterium]|nr:glycosyltransferase family 4 protein [Anaerolineae bacterium]
MFPKTIHIMTAGLTPGDAVSNFVLSSGRILREFGVQVYLYADHIAPPLASEARHSRFYPNTGQDFLWFHYSIYADNVELALSSRDVKLLDFHGICPPHLFAGQNEHLAFLCQQGLDVLPTLHNRFDHYVVHSEYSREWLQSLNFPAAHIHKVFYCIDTAQFTGEDAALAASLSQLEYFLMVGRIVPQKDVLALVAIFSHINQARPNTVLILVGTRQQTGKYQQQIETLIAQKGLQDRVLFTDQVNNPAVLEALFRHARLLFVTSEWESFCVPVAESLYFGTPTAVHHVPPLPEVAGPAGLVFDKADPQAAAAQVLALLADDGRYQQMRQAAAPWAAQYSDAALAENLKGLFNRIKLSF